MNYFAVLLDIMRNVKRTVDFYTTYHIVLISLQILQLYLLDYCNIFKKTVK